MKKKTTLLIILDIIAIIGLFVLYGPFNYFRTLYITTAMNTKTHRYLANVLYSTKQITKVMGENFVTQIDENTNQNDIVFNNEDTENYESIYEEQILKRDEGNDDYKIVELDGEGYHAYLTVVYDASKLSTVKSKYYGNRGQYLSEMAKQNGALVAINGGGFLDVNGDGDGARAGGIFISNSEIIENDSGIRRQIIGISNKNVLTLGYMTAEEAIENGIRDAVCFGPFLIVNGKAAEVSGNGGMGVNPRTVIAQRKDGVILFLTVDGSGNKYGFRGGASINQLIEILERYGAYNAANLDGGASSVLAVDGVTYNSPVAYSSSGERWLPNGWIVK